MANSFIASTKLLKQSKHHFIRHPLNSAVSFAADHSPHQNLPTDISQKPAESPIIDLSDSPRLFANIPTSKLIRSNIHLHLATFPPLVDVGIKVMNSKLMTMPVASDVILAFIRKTFFEHFCAGESAEEAVETCEEVSREMGIKGMLVYGVEHADDNIACEKNYNGFLKIFESVKG